MALQIKKRLMLVGLENITHKKTNEKLTMHTFVDKTGAIVKGYLPGWDNKDYTDKLVELEGELAYNDDKAHLFPFNMSDWEGQTKFVLQSKNTTKK